MHMRIHALKLAAPAAVALALVACGGGGDSEPPPSTTPPTTEAASTEPRIFFVSPKDGDEVTSPVSFEFGAENLSVDPVVDPPVVTPGSIHFHVGYNTDCLPAGEVIPKADPWVHFGDGSKVFETQLDPGTYKLALQAGDGEHRTLEGDGYCDVINITVVEGDAAAAAEGDDAAAEPEAEGAAEGE
jgi:hypothetical protein